jgi:hypothetical protein
VNTDLLPFSGLDQANHFLFNLFDYVNYEGTPVAKGEKKDIRNFFNNKKEKFKAFTPIKYPDKSRTTFLEQQQLENEREYKHLRERARLLTNELAEMGKAGDPDMRDKIKKKIVEEIEKEFEEEYKNKRHTGTPEEGDKLKQDRLREYLNAIDEIEHGLGGENTKPLFNGYFSNGNFEGMSHLQPGSTGGKKKKRKNNLICFRISEADSRNRSRFPSARRGKLFRSSQKKKDKRRNKTLKNRK